MQIALLLSRPGRARRALVALAIAAAAATASVEAVVHDAPEPEDVSAVATEPSPAQLPSAASTRADAQNPPP